MASGEVFKGPGGIELDIAAHEVKIDGKSISLSFKEFELLTLLRDESGGWPLFQREDSQ